MKDTRFKEFDNIDSLSRFAKTHDIIHWEIIQGDSFDGNDKVIVQYILNKGERE